MHSRFLILACAALLCLSMIPRAAGRSDVADAAMRDNKAAVRALLAQKVDVNAPQADGATALHWAVYTNDQEMAELLVRAGANIKAVNRIGVSPLSMASLNGSPPLVEL